MHVHFRKLLRFYINNFTIYCCESVLVCCIIIQFIHLFIHSWFIRILPSFLPSFLPPFLIRSFTYPFILPFDCPSSFISYCFINFNPFFALWNHSFLSIIYQFMRSFIHSFISSFFHSFIHSFLHSFLPPSLPSFINYPSYPLSCCRFQ